MLQFSTLRGFLFFLFLFNYVSSKVSPGFADCTHFFYKNTPPIIITSTPNAIDICQEYQNAFYFATKYFSNYHIPLYSAYVLDSLDDNFDRDVVKNQNWRIGQDITIYYTNLNNNAKEKDIMESDFQAKDKDYLNSGWSRGHLNPVYHNRDSKEKMKATFILTNAAPQAESFNGGAWANSVERPVYTLLNNSCRYEGARRFVITGTKPSEPNKEEFKSPRFNVPSHFWTAVCCDTSSVTNKENRIKGWSIAAYGTNLATTKYVTKISIPDLNNFLRFNLQNASKEILLFGEDNCEFKKNYEMTKIIMQNFINS